MSEPKFTAGPWKICKDGKYPCKMAWSIPGDFPIATADGVHVGTAHKHMADAPDMIYATISDDMRTANAHLIAAAPELYAALDRVLLDFDFMIERGVVSDVRDDIIYVAARAALAKARGET